MLTESIFPEKYTHVMYLRVANELDFTESYELRNFCQTIGHKSFNWNNAVWAAIPELFINGRGLQRNILVGLIFSRWSSNLPRFKSMTVK